MRLEIYTGDAVGNYERQEFKNLVEALPNCELAYWKTTHEPAEKDKAMRLMDVKVANIHDMLVWNVEGTTLVYDGIILVDEKLEPNVDVKRRARITLSGEREKVEGLLKVIKEKIE